MMPAEMAPVHGTVTSQARMMLRNRLQSTESFDLTQPTVTTEPTLQWVVLTGIPRLEAISTVIADPSSIVKPLK